jgi:hypothetical protein
VQHGLLKLVAMVGGRKEPTIPAHGNLLREQEISPTCAASYLPGRHLAVPAMAAQGRRLAGEGFPLANQLVGHVGGTF